MAIANKKEVNNFFILKMESLKNCEHEYKDSFSDTHFNKKGFIQRLAAFHSTVFNIQD